MQGMWVYWKHVWKNPYSVFFFNYHNSSHSNISTNEITLFFLLWCWRLYSVPYMLVHWALKFFIRKVATTEVASYFSHRCGESFTSFRPKSKIIRKLFLLWFVVHLTDSLKERYLRRVQWSIWFCGAVD